MKFRKKPVVIEAVQLRWDTWNEMCEHVKGDTLTVGCYVDKKGYPTDTPTDKMGLKINTLEGIMLAEENDWVIKGVKGELYPCKPDIFEMTYESVADEADSWHTSGE